MTKIELDFSKLVLNVKGEPIPDMLDVTDGTDPASCPSLSVGSLIAHALTLAIRCNPKEARRYHEIAFNIELALKKKDGKLEVSEGEISQIEEGLNKMSNPTFQTVVYSGAMQEFLDNAKVTIQEAKKIG